MSRTEYFLPWAKTLGVSCLVMIAIMGWLLEPPPFCNLHAANASDKGRESPSADDLQDDNNSQMIDYSKGCHPELLTLLRNRIHELDEREKRLDAREKDLKFLEQDIEQKIKQLGKLQRELEGPVKKRRIEEQAKLQHLAGVYSSMEPARAAALLDRLDDETVTKLFSIMKSKKVAGILANMSPEKAARISTYLYRKPPSD